MCGFLQCTLAIKWNYLLHYSNSSNSNALRYSENDKSGRKRKKLLWRKWNFIKPRIDRRRLNEKLFKYTQVHWHKAPRSLAPSSLTCVCSTIEMLNDEQHFHKRKLLLNFYWTHRSSFANLTLNLFKIHILSMSFKKESPMHKHRRL